MNIFSHIGRIVMRDTVIMPEDVDTIQTFGDDAVLITTKFDGDFERSRNEYRVDHSTGQNGIYVNDRVSAPTGPNVMGTVIQDCDGMFCVNWDNTPDFEPRQPLHGIAHILTVTGYVPFAEVA